MFRPTPAFSAQAMNQVHASLTMAHAEERMPEGMFFHPVPRTAARVMPLDYARFVGRAIASSAVPLAQTIRSGIAADVAIEDWDVLMTAVKERQRVSVSERFAAISDAPLSCFNFGRRTSLGIECSKIHP